MVEWWWVFVCVLQMHLFLTSSWWWSSVVPAPSQIWWRTPRATRWRKTGSPTSPERSSGSVISHSLLPTSSLDYIICVRNVAKSMILNNLTFAFKQNKHLFDRLIQPVFLISCFNLYFIPPGISSPACSSCHSPRHQRTKRAADWKRWSQAGWVSWL